MMIPPTHTEFSTLLTCLDREPLVASEKYEELRLRITKILIWRGCPESDADSLADVTLDRIARKLSEGLAINNFHSYAASVCRFVWLEHKRRHLEDAVGDELPEISTDPRELLDDPDFDERVLCIRKCLTETFPDKKDRDELINYYDLDEGEKYKEMRRRLAQSIGVSVNTLRVKMCRLRAKLDLCVKECVDTVMKRVPNTTTKQEAIGE